MTLAAGQKEREYFDRVKQLFPPSSPTQVVVKYGGSAMLDEAQRSAFYCQLVFLAQQGISFVLVHGGGHQITAALKAAGLKARFHQGLRVTDDATMRISEEVLINQVSPQIVEEINACWNCYDGQQGALGLDSREILQSEPLNASLGRVGKVVEVTRLAKALQTNPILVLPPIGRDRQSKLSYNINADWAAASVAMAMKAPRLIYITDEDGILDAQGKRIAEISLADLGKLREDGTISAGMIPKTQSIIAAARNGIKKTQVISGAEPYFLCRALIGDEEIGTLVVGD